MFASKLRVLVVGSSDNEEWVRAALGDAELRSFSSKLDTADRENELQNRVESFLEVGWWSWFQTWVLRSGNDKYLRVVVLDEWVCRDTSHEIHHVSARLRKQLRGFPQLLVLLSRGLENQRRDPIETGVDFEYDTNQSQEHFSHLVKSFSRLLRTQRLATLWILLCWLTTVFFFLAAPPLMHYLDLWVEDTYAAHSINSSAEWDVEVFANRPRSSKLIAGYRWSEFRLVLSNLGINPVQGFKFETQGNVRVLGLPKIYSSIVRDSAEISFLVGFPEKEAPNGRPSVSITGPLSGDRPEVRFLIDPAAQSSPVEEGRGK